jgi:hypothetical protein
MAVEKIIENQFRVAEKHFRGNNIAGALVSALEALRSDNHCWCRTWVGGEHETACEQIQEAIAATRAEVITGVVTYDTMENQRVEITIREIAPLHLETLSLPRKES